MQSWLADLCARLECPNLAPAIRVNLLARENIARSPFVAFLALQLHAVRAMLTGFVLGILRGIHLLRVVYIRQRHRKRILLIDLSGCCLCRCISNDQSASWECGEAMMSAAAHVWLQNYFKRQRQMRPVRKAVTA